ncbi:MAG: hypothetical protein KDI36_15690 [Pseudomonadales bacterium]|nr:hypothetical protein [Pseudomonadales bacterium]
MKTMSCKQLGGACETQFRASTFEEMAELSKQHGMQMYKEQDAAHLKAMEEMRKIMDDPEEMNRWFESRRKEFDELPES